MKKLNILSIICVFILFGCSEDLSDYSEPEGLYVGYSFESRPDEFYIYRGANYDVEWTQEDSFDGTGSLKIASDNEEGQIFAYWTLRLYDLPVDKTIKIRVRVKTKDLNGDGWTISMGTRSQDESIVEFTGLGDKGATDGWEEYGLSLINPIPEGIDYMDFYLLLLEETSGTVYFDKMEVIAE
ncbi:MAG: hypothetical protein R8G66_13970 [Cytophagales bacterium]|nr:hypothetical protein [Cytophagales bacterium]